MHVACRGLRRLGKTNNNKIFRMRGGSIQSSLQGPDALEGRNSHGAVLPGDVLVWALSALTQAFRVPFDEKLDTGQCRRRTGSTRLSLRPTCSDCVPPERSGRPPHCGNGSPRSRSFFLPFYASRPKASSPVVRVLPPLTPRRRTSGSPSSCASKQTAQRSMTGTNPDSMPGILVSAEIHPGTRTVMKYLLSPVSVTQHQAGREL